MMWARRDNRHTFGWLEVLCALAVVMLLMQLSASIRGAALALVDFRYWPPGTLLVINIAAVVILVAVRSRGVSWPKVKLRTIWWSKRRATVSETPSLKEKAYAKRVQRDAEWRERARKRLPFT